MHYAFRPLNLAPIDFQRRFFLDLKNACYSGHFPHSSFLCTTPMSVLGTQEIVFARFNQKGIAMKTLLKKLVKDEQGGEVLEYALIAGLIVVAAIAIIGSVGSKVLGRWTSLNNSM